MSGMLRSFGDLFRHANSRKGQIVRALAADSKRSFWAMADQGVVSLGNFGVNILLAKSFERQGHIDAFGSFWVLMELMLFLNGMQAAMVVYPLTVRGAVHDRTELGRMTSMSLLLTLLAWPIFATAVVLTALVAHISLAAGLWAAAAMAFWQIQETTRRSLMAHLYFRSALLGDSISYLGQVAAVGWLAYTGRLSLATTFEAMFITSGLAAIVQALQVGLRGATLSHMRGFVRECWSLGRWVLLGNLSGLFTGTLFNWNFAFWAGRELLGVYYAMSNLLRLANPLSCAISTLIMPTAAKARQEQGLPRARRVMQRFGLLGALLLSPYLGFLLLLPSLAIGVVYGRDSSYLQYTLMLQIATIATALTYAATATGAFLNAIERSRNTFVAQLVYASAFVLIAMPLTARYHLLGAAAGWAIAAMLQLAVNGWYVLKLSREDEQQPQVRPLTQPLP